MITSFLHSGVEVADLNSAIKLYQSIGFEIVNQFSKPEPKAQVATVKKGETAIELWEFENKDHPQVQFIRNHMAFGSNNLEEDVKRLEKQGYKITIPITEGVILRYVFVQDPSGANFEIATDKH